MQIRCNVCSTTVTIGDDIARALAKRGGTIPCRSCRAAVPVMADPAWANTHAGPPRMPAPARPGLPPLVIPASRATSPGISALGEIDPAPHQAAENAHAPHRDAAARSTAEPSIPVERSTAREPAASSPRTTATGATKNLATPGAPPVGPPRAAPGGRVAGLPGPGVSIIRTATMPVAVVPPKPAAPKGAPSIVRTATMPVALMPPAEPGTTRASAQERPAPEGNAQGAPALPPARPTTPGVGAKGAVDGARPAPAARPPLPSRNDEAAKAANVPTKPGVPAAKAANVGARPAAVAAPSMSRREPHEPSESRANPPPAAPAQKGADPTARRTERASYRPIPPLPIQKVGDAQATRPTVARRPETAARPATPVNSPQAIAPRGSARGPLPSRTATRLGLSSDEARAIEVRPAHEFPKPPTELPDDVHDAPTPHVEARVPTEARAIEARAAIAPSAAEGAPAPPTSVPDLTAAADLSDDEPTIAGSFSSLLGTSPDDDDDRPTRRPPAVGEVEGDDDVDDSLPTLPPAPVHFRSEPAEEIDEEPTSIEPVNEAVLADDVGNEQGFEPAELLASEPPIAAPSPRPSETRGAPALPTPRPSETRGAPARPPPPPARAPLRTGSHKALAPTPAAPPPFVSAPIATAATRSATSPKVAATAAPAVARISPAEEAMQAAAPRTAPSIPPLHGPGSISAVAMTSSRVASPQAHVAPMVPSVPAPAFPSALAADVARVGSRRQSSKTTAMGSAFVALCVIVGAGYFGAVSGRPKAAPPVDTVKTEPTTETPAPRATATSTAEAVTAAPPSPPPPSLAPAPPIPAPRETIGESNVANREPLRERVVKTPPPSDEPRERPVQARKEKPPRSAPSDESGGSGPAETRLPDSNDNAKSIDQGALRQAFAEGEAKAKSCVGASSPTGIARLSVTFSPSGEATGAVVLGAPFANTIEGQCISAKFRALHVPPFSGADVIVRKSINFL